MRLQNCLDKSAALRFLCATDWQKPAYPVKLNPVKLTTETLQEVERLLEILPAADTAAVGWRDYGEVIVCDSQQQMLQLADEAVADSFMTYSLQLSRCDWGNHLE